jgi:hypothetical protein
LARQVQQVPLVLLVQQVLLAQLAQQDRKVGRST